MRGRRLVSETWLAAAQTDSRLAAHMAWAMNRRSQSGLVVAGQSEAGQIELARSHSTPHSQRLDMTARARPAQGHDEPGAISDESASATTTGSLDSTETTTTDDGECSTTTRSRGRGGRRERQHEKPTDKTTTTTEQHKRRGELFLVYSLGAALTNSADPDLFQTSPTDQDPLGELQDRFPCCVPRLRKPRHRMWIGACWDSRKPISVPSWCTSCAP